MLATSSHNLGNPIAAMVQARTAAVCADNADHHTMRAWVRSLQRPDPRPRPRPRRVAHGAWRDSITYSILEQERSPISGTGEAAQEGGNGSDSGPPL
ncbi:hypothetical protein [Streptomyces sp. NRRL S-495]|uniref:hypothetical protein n=1 Tax=Streptomyces sp. NRRL S-495 TaxID=1609133 RepID=UPI0005F98837|nr:hypothetical protein [Streptomyces sp. NRRL S-495]KJY34930.1 hypothetical protein VR45_15500 [Streptomyces sp. NRRL S-495]